MKFCLYIALCCSLIYYSFESASYPRLETLGDGEYCIYSTQAISSPLVTRRIETGFSYIYHCASSDAANLRALFDRIDGESITLTNISIRKVLKTLGYGEVSATYDGVMNVCYAYSNRGKAYIKLGRSKINLQVAERENIITVGWPVILGSY